MKAGALFEATFQVAEIDMSDDPKTSVQTKLKKFESVSRLKGIAVGKKEAAEKLQIILDYNCDIYPLEEGQKVRMEGEDSLVCVPTCCTPLRYIKIRICVAAEGDCRGQEEGGGEA